MRAGLLALGLLLLLPIRPATAHEIPTDVVVRGFVVPEDDRLRLLLRVPLEAMRDIEFPLRGPGYLDLEAVEPRLRDAARLWLIDYLTLYEDGRRLGEPEIAAIRVSLPSDRSFAEWDDALAHVAGEPLPAVTELYWEQGLLDVLLEYPVRSASSDFAIRPELAHLGLETLTVLRFRPPGGAERVFQYRGDPGTVSLDPSWIEAAGRFTELGFHHILGGLDHLLFLLCLVIPFRSFVGLVPVVTSFTVAHSITLIASAMGLAPDALWFPPLIETLIALSIVYMALENIVGMTGLGRTRPDAAEQGRDDEGTTEGAAGGPGAWLERRWLFAFGFGLVHGFGFSFLLRDSLQFAGTHLLSSLLAFNVGVELGQLLVLVVAIPVLELLFRYGIAERIGTILLSALVAHSAWHWMTARGGTLAQYDVQWPALDAAFAASAMRWLMLLLIVVGAAWALWEAFAWWGRARRAGRAVGGRQSAVSGSSR